MAIPKLKKQDVIDALKFIDENGVPEHNTSVKYVLVSEDGKKYPPKYVVAVADHLANSTDMLFSNTPVSKYFILGSSGTKNAIDKHHIFPKNYLTGIGFTSDRDRNQIANFTYLDYATNIEISDKAPQDYVPHYRQKLGEDGYYKACKEHALPENFEHMEYADFLSQRRLLMAQIIRKAYEQLCE